MIDNFKIMESFRRPYDLRDKAESIAHHISYMLAQTNCMIEYEGLPDTMPARDVTLGLQVHGYMVIPDPKLTDGKMYALWGGLGGEPDPYYMPTVATVANPALNFSKQMKIHEECVVVPHDSMYMGLLPIFRKYGTILAENELSMLIGVINSRIPFIGSADDDRTYQSLQDFFKAVEDGKLGGVFEGGLSEGLKTSPYTAQGSTGMMINLIEMEQYLKASEYNAIGVNANYNMKREAINSNESQLNDDALIPAIDDIVNTMQKGWDEVNERFGTNIHVRLSSVWHDRQLIQAIQTGEKVPEGESGGPGDNGTQTQTQKTEEPGENGGDGGTEG